MKGPTRRKRKRNTEKKLVAYSAYTDYSDKDAAWVEEQASQLQLKAAKKSSGGPKVPFPYILYDMLEAVQADERRSLIVSWQPHGRAFRVHNPKEFQTSVLPMHFKQQSSYASFQRQLNIYGFRRLTGQHRDQNAYYHKFFLRTCKHLCALLTRDAGSTTGESVRCAFDVSTEPDFYTMPPLPSSGTIGDSREVLVAVDSMTGRSAESPALNVSHFAPASGGMAYGQDRTLDAPLLATLPTADRSSRVAAQFAEFKPSTDRQVVPSHDWYSGDRSTSVSLMRDDGSGGSNRGSAHHSYGSAGSAATTATSNTLLSMHSPYSTAGVPALSSPLYALAMGAVPHSRYYASTHQTLARPRPESGFSVPPPFEAVAVAASGGVTAGHRSQRAAPGNYGKDNGASALVQAVHQSLQRRAAAAEEETSAATDAPTTTSALSTMPAAALRLANSPLGTLADVAHGGDDAAAHREESSDGSRLPPAARSPLSKSPSQQHMDLFDDQSILSNDGSLSQSCGSTSSRNYQET